MKVWPSGLLVILIWGAPVRAEPVDRCLGAHEGGQKAELEKQFSMAADRYRICAAASCPDLVRRDCAERLAVLEANLPSLSVRVLRGGEPLADVRLTLDGDEMKGGDAVRVKAGDHVLRVSSSDGATDERRMTLQRGEHRELEIELPSAQHDPSQEVRRSGGVLPYVLGGVAIAGLAGFVGFALAGKAKQNELNDCKPRCRDGSLYDDMQRRYLFADLSLGIGLAAGIGAYLTLPTGKTSGKDTGRPTLFHVGGRF